MSGRKSNARLRREQTNAEFKARRGLNYFDFHLTPKDLADDLWDSDEYEYDEDDCE